MRRRLASLVLAACGLLLTAAADPADFAFRQNPGAALPLSQIFRGDDGTVVRLGAVLRGLPTVLTLGYFHCPNLCGVVREDVFHALNAAGLVAGRDYTMVALSIDPSETAHDARVAKTQDVAAFGGPGAASGWHYLTGSAEAVQAVADSVGFREKFDAQAKQFFHPAGVVVAMPDGTVSGYLLGVGYTPTDMRAAVSRAAAGRVAALAAPVLLFCFHFDPQTGRYTLAVYKLLRLAAALTVLTLGGTMLLALCRGRSA